VRSLVKLFFNFVKGLSKRRACHLCDWSNL